MGSTIPPPPGNKWSFKETFINFTTLCTQRLISIYIVHSGVKIIPVDWCLLQTNTQFKHFFVCERLFPGHAKISHNLSHCEGFFQRKCVHLNYCILRLRYFFTCSKHVLLIFTLRTRFVDTSDAHHINPFNFFCFEIFFLFKC